MDGPLVSAMKRLIRDEQAAASKRAALFSSVNMQRQFDWWDGYSAMLVELEMLVTVEIDRTSLIEELRKKQYDVVYTGRANTNRIDGKLMAVDYVLAMTKAI